MFSDKIVCAIRVMNLLAYSPPGQRSARGIDAGFLKELLGVEYSLYKSVINTLIIGNICYTTNAQLYRIYIERYLCSLPVVNQDLDLIISQKEMTTYGVPIQVYFFSRNKVWKEYERIQSDIFDHLLVMVQKFDLKLYQYSD